MADATAQLSNYRQSPRKVGRMADAIRGKSVTEAIAVLQVTPKRAAAPLEKLLRSAVSNARGKGLLQEELVISKIIVGKGITFKRSTPRARGSSALIRKKASHVKVELSRLEQKTSKKATKKAPKAKAPAAPEESATE